MWKSFSRLSSFHAAICMIQLSCLRIQKESSTHNFILTASGQVSAYATDSTTVLLNSKSLIQLQWTGLNPIMEQVKMHVPAVHEAIEKNVNPA